MTSQPHPFDFAPIAKAIWQQKYQLRGGDLQVVDGSIEATWARIGEAAAEPERGGKRAKSTWARRFAEGMSDFGFLPAGRIIAGAGAGRDVTLFNCFVMGPVADDLSAIFGSVREAALTMQAGGGIGQDFSTLRPKGALVRSIGADASGPVSFMDVWDAMCRTIMSAGARRGAMMATMRCDHPDIETFIAAKAEAGRLRNFNLSVLVTDRFVAAVRGDEPWDLVFDGKVYATVRAGALWDRIMRATYEYAEPGVIFIDRINAANNLAYCEEIHATNPCGEQPLPAYGACLLGSINLTRFVTDPFGPSATMDVAGIEERVRLAVRLLDNAIDISRYPLAAQQKEARAKRRIGLGVTGLADALIMCGLRYGEAAALKAAGDWMAAVQNAAYAASAELAAKKGSFPLYDAVKFATRPNVLALRPETRAAIARHGLRNGCLTSIAPTGTISLLAGNVSSGIEPVFDFAYRRRIKAADGTEREETIEDYAFALHRRLKGREPKRGGAFVTAGDLQPGEHLAMQAALQQHVDSSISKTINCPVDLPFASFQDIYLQAYDLGLKGCTTFRPNAVTGSVLTAVQPPAPAVAVPAATAHASAIATSHPVESAVVYMAKPLERDPVLAGFTYKLTWPGQDNALYVTINDIERGGRLCPFEIFINTKNLEHYAWTVALTRMISAIFRRGGDLAFVVEELKAIFDPQGGRWMEGRYVPSLLAAIGEVIELHMIRIGFMRPVDGAQPAVVAAAKRATAASSEGATIRRSAAAMIEPLGPGAERRGAAQAANGPVGRVCPRCAGLSLVRVEGCWSCQACGYARCE
ncbi:MAG: adenosylcobalamin-dependent ribonucleoside-diphosphate reductase [Hyphomicrobiaceae bacterium]